MKLTISAIYRDPFTIGSPMVTNLPPGLRLSKLFERLSHLPKGSAESGEIRIDDHPVPREHWHLVKPKAMHANEQIHVIFHANIFSVGAKP